MNDTDQLPWRKSSRSYGAGECIEVASCPCPAEPGFPSGVAHHEPGTGPDVVYVRDTKQARRQNRVTLTFPARAWREFTASVKDGAA